MDEQLMQHQPPQSLEAEQAVLGSILIDSRCITEVVGVVKPEDFYLQQNREIYETIYTMFNFSQTIDPVTVLDKLKELGYYHDNSRDYILQLMEITPTAANVVRYANIVKDKAMRMFMFKRSYQVQHINGLTFDFLYDMAKKLAEADALMLVGGGAKGNEPLVMSNGGTPYRAFLEGRVNGESYALILRLTNLELKEIPTK